MLSPEELRDRLRGVLIFATTPFDRTTLDVDLEGFRGNMEHLVRGGIRAVAVAGFVGEFSALTFEEYRAVVRTAREALGPEVVIVAGVGGGTHVAVQFAAIAETAGADCAMLLPPYLVEPTDDGMFEHTSRIARATRLGLMLHSMPGFAFVPQLVERLSEIPTVVAYKDELGDIRGFAEIVARVGDRLAYVNGRAEPVMGFYAAAGATMLASAIGNFDPALALAAYAAAAALDFPRLRELLAPRAMPWYRLRERNRGFLISVSKASMDAVGLRGGAVRPPLSDLKPDTRRELLTVLESVGYIQGGAQ